MAKGPAILSRVLARLTNEAQAEILPLLEAVFIDALIEIAGDKTMDDAHKAGASDFAERSISHIRTAMLAITAKPRAPRKEVHYGPPPPGSTPINP